MLKCAPKNCQECGKRYTPTGRCSKFCSKTCWKKYHDLIKLKRRTAFRNSAQWIGQGGTSKRGPEHHSYTTGIKNFPRFKKDACERCGSKRYLLVHHRDEDRTNNVESNAETLCKSCHQRHHNCAANLPKKFTAVQIKRRKRALKISQQQLVRRTNGTYRKLRRPRVETEKQYHRRLSRGKREAWVRRKAREQSWRDRLVLGEKVVASGKYLAVK